MKRHPLLRDLSEDHHAALVLARRCRRATTATRDRTRAELRRAIPERLEPHFAIEEQHLLPALTRLGEDALVERIREDHAVLRGHWAEADPGPEQLHAIGRRLEQHVRFEEREVFERCQDRLPQAVLDAIGQACRERAGSGGAAACDGIEAQPRPASRSRSSAKRSTRKS